MTHVPPKQLQALIDTQPDLVDRIFDYLISEFPHLAGNPEHLATAEKAVRAEFAGEKVWVNKQSPARREELAGEVLRLFNGRNASEVARRLGVSRATVYRIIKQPG